MVSYKVGHIASIPQIYTSTTLKNHNRRTALERTEIKYWGLKRVLLDPNPRPKPLQWFKTFGPHKGLKDWKFNVFKFIDRRIFFYSQNTNMLPRKAKIN